MMEDNYQLEGRSIELTISPPVLSVSSMTRILVRRRGIALATYIFILAVCCAYCFFWPPTYQANARILVKNDRQDPILSTDQQSIQTQSRALVTEEDLNTESAILQSGQVLKQAVLRAGVDKMPDHWLVRLLNAPVDWVAGIYDSYHREPKSDDLARGVERLQKKLVVAPEKRSDVIAVQLEWGNAEEATLILKDVVDAYLERHLAAHEEPATQQFFKEQLDAKNAELTELDRSIALVRPGRSLAVVTEEERQRVNGVASLEADWRRASAASLEIAARVSELQKELAAAPERVVTEERPVINLMARSNLESQLLELQRKQADLRTKYKDENRFVIQNREELAAAEGMLRGETDSPMVEKTTSINKIADSLRQELALAKANLEGSRSLQEGVRNNLEASTKQLNQLSSQGEAMRQLEQRRQTTLASVVLYSRRLEEARATDAMNRRQMMNVALIEPVQADPDIARPRVGLILKLAFGLGLLVAVAAAFLIEMLEDRVYTTDDVSRLTAAPVLAEIPQWNPSNALVLWKGDQVEWK